MSWGRENSTSRRADGLQTRMGAPTPPWVSSLLAYLAEFELTDTHSLPSVQYGNFALNHAWELQSRDCFLCSVRKTCWSSDRVQGSDLRVPNGTRDLSPWTLPSEIFALSFCTILASSIGKPRATNSKAFCEFSHSLR